MNRDDLRNAEDFFTVEATVSFFRRAVSRVAQKSPDTPWWTTKRPHEYDSSQLVKECVQAFRIGLEIASV